MDEESLEMKFPGALFQDKKMSEDPITKEILAEIAKLTKNSHCGNWAQLLRQEKQIL